MNAANLYCKASESIGVTPDVVDCRLRDNDSLFMLPQGMPQFPGFNISSSSQRNPSNRAITHTTVRRISSVRCTSHRSAAGWEKTGSLFIPLALGHECLWERICGQLFSLILRFFRMIISNGVRYN